MELSPFSHRNPCHQGSEVLLQVIKMCRKTGVLRPLVALRNTQANASECR